MSEAGEIVTLVPARLERLPWGRFHLLVVAALGWRLGSRFVEYRGVRTPLVTRLETTP